MAENAQMSTREEILQIAWAMCAEGGVAGMRMADVADAAGVSRQTVYNQFGSRAGLLVAMVRHADATNPRVPEMQRAAEIEEPLEALDAFVRSMSRRWPEIHPVARALHAATLTDEDARSAWEDRMQLVWRLARRVTNLLAESELLADGWTPDAAADWLWSLVNPVHWLLLAHDRGWRQEEYEERLVRLTRLTLVKSVADSVPQPAARIAPAPPAAPR